MTEPEGIYPNKAESLNEYYEREAEEERQRVRILAAEKLVRRLKALEDKDGR